MVYVSLTGPFGVSSQFGHLGSSFRIPDDRAANGPLGEKEDMHGNSISVHIFVGTPSQRQGGVAHLPGPIDSRVQWG